VSNVETEVDSSPLIDGSGIPSARLSEELRLAGYLEGLIADTLAHKASEVRRGDWALEERPLGGLPDSAPGLPDDPVTPDIGQPDSDCSQADASGGEMPPGGRASMSEELAALFRPTEQGSAAPLEETESREEPETCGEAAPLTPRPSVFLRRFLQQDAARPRELLSSGIAGLDVRLGGGFGPGLHLVTGASSGGRTSLLASVVWETVASERPIIYYTLREGGLQTWERLITALGSILGEPPVPLASRRGGLAGADVEVLTRLDAALQRSVLPFLCLVETIPAHPDALGSFVEDVLSRAREARDSHRKTPLVVVDDLDRLLFLTAYRRPRHLLYHLDEVLSGDAVPGLLAAALPSRPGAGVETRPAQTTLVLEPARFGQDNDLATMDLRLVANNQTGWTGTLPLLVDRRTGLVAENRAAGARDRAPQ
jgi:hypothetical protein